MMAVIDGLLILASGLVLLPVLVLATELLAALWPARSALEKPARRDGRVAVLIPAHDEAASIGRTLDCVIPQLRDDDTLLVVADNCSDDTAAVARSHGAQVVERRNTAQRGKGYALDFGVQQLREQAPDILVIVDADCLLEADGLDRLVAAAQASGRPAQALYLMRRSASPGLTEQFRHFAWVVKNRVRALGLMNLGLPCPLMGTGMAFPWPLIREVSLANGCLVEDLKLGLDLTRAGAAPIFCPQALVTSEFPSQADAAEGQRTRWEHGHLAMIGSELPGLLQTALSRRDLGVLALALDLCVPPLALLSMLLLGLFGAAALAALLGASLLPLQLMSAGLAFFGAVVLLTWRRFGRDSISAGALAALPWYIAGKIPLYIGFFRSRQQEWVRTRRD